MSEIITTSWFNFLSYSEYDNGQSNMNSWNTFGSLSAASDGINNDSNNNAQCNHGQGTGATGTFYTKVIRLYNPNISIPSRGKLIGIEARVNGFGGTATITNYEYLIQLTWNGALVGNNKSQGASFPAVFQSGAWTFNRGGQNDLWGYDLELDDLFQSPQLFGIDFQGRQVDNSSGATNAIGIAEIQARFFVDATAMLSAL